MFSFSCFGFPGEGEIVLGVDRGEPGGVGLDREAVAEIADTFRKGFAGHRELH